MASLGNGLDRAIPEPLGQLRDLFLGPLLGFDDQVLAIDISGDAGWAGVNDAGRRWLKKTFS